MQKKKLKKFSGILLLLCLAAPLIVTYSWLQLEKYQIKSEVKWRMIEGIDKSELVFLKLSNTEVQNELKWKHSREFEYKGEMYDVVEKMVKADSTFYWLWWDHEETALNQRLSDLLAQTVGQSQENKNNHKRLYQFLNTLYFCSTIDWQALIPYSSQDLNTTYLNNYKSFSSNPPTPPPDLALFF